MWHIKIFGQNIETLAHSENLKSARIYLLPYFYPLWDKNIRASAQKFIKYRQFIVGSSKSLHYGPVFKIVLYKIFFNVPF
jgi:hypothetical protein